MNEQRIKTFADLADRYAYSISDSDPSVNWYKIRDQKFAELIVRECAEFIAPMGDYCGGHGEPSAPSSRECARRLKQYFGVEK